MEISREKIKALLESERTAKNELFAEAHRVRLERAGRGTYLRGLIEYSNICRKNCLYCGIRAGNCTLERYTLSHAQVMTAARYAWESGYGSVVIQGGENVSSGHVEMMTRIISDITTMTGGELGITLSLGEQSRETYDRWLDAGAHRYLLRIESSSPELYAKIHPQDGCHLYENRVRALQDLREVGYQVGTGVMIGLPFQTTDDLVGDLLFMKNLDIDMCGMGPYIVSRGTPLADLAAGLWPASERLEMTLRMIAVLRLLLPDINIAATTALEAIDPRGRMRALESGANVFMPNVTPAELRNSYDLYDNKPQTLSTELAGCDIRFDEKGDPQHFVARRKSPANKS